MDNYQQEMRKEKAYLEKTLAFIRKELKSGNETLSNRKDRLIAARRDMWENTAHSTSDFTKLTEVNQHLMEINNQTSGYKNMKRQIEKYERILGSPYFGRFDFMEDGEVSEEKIYIGLYNVIDPKTHNIYVYDWRAPISGIFYNSELGKASYNAPMGLISGDVTLKRQYKIRNSRLEYFFDCSVRISDEVLQEALSRNSSPRMRNIVETIQKEQNAIIRDTDNELLIVQGVAGSGKTSIALHRIAYLLYEGMNLKAGSNNIVIISPNAVFSKYISSVLPELGEENVGQMTFDDIVSKCFENRFVVEKWHSQAENIILWRNSRKGDIKKEAIQFKGSVEFIQILDRLLVELEHNIIAFEDVYYDGKILMTRQQIKNDFLNNKIGMPVVKRLRRIEDTILKKVNPMKKKQLERIQEIVHKKGGHEFEVKSFSRLLSLKKTKAFSKSLKSFTEVDYFKVYKLLFSDLQLFYRLAEGFKLPSGIGKIILETRNNLKKGYVGYEDCGPLIYLKLKMEGSELFPEIRQIVIDEAQDYYPIQYEAFKLLFKDARYTVLGDVNQAIEKDADVSLYDSVIRILDRKSAVKLFLNKSYRASYEINTFTQKMLKNKYQDFISFERHEAEPVVSEKNNEDSIDEAVANDIGYFFEQGYESVAIICKTQKEADDVYGRLNSRVRVSLISPRDGEVHKGASVIPSYIAKGLEFDAVIVYNAAKENYSTGFDRKLLYVACTRALHRLVIYHTGEKSPFL